MRTSLVRILLVFVLALAGEAAVFRSMSIEQPWFVCAALALTVVGTVGALYGLGCALDLARRAKIPRRDWKDGELVVIGGRLSAIGQAVRAPLSGKPSLVYQYQMAKKANNNRLSLGFFGAGMVPCAITNQSGPIRIVGFPNMARISETSRAEVSIEHAADHLSGSKLDRASILQLASFARHFQKLMSDADGELRTDLVIEATGEGIPASPDRHGLLEILSGSRWKLTERSLSPGEEVVAAGTYRRNPDRLDVGSWVLSSRHFVFRGSAATAIRREIVRAALILVGSVAVAGVAHVAVYMPDLVPDQMRSIRP